MDYVYRVHVRVAVAVLVVDRSARSAAANHLPFRADTANPWTADLRLLTSRSSAHQAWMNIAAAARGRQGGRCLYGEGHMVWLNCIIVRGHVQGVESTKAIACPRRWIRWVQHTPQRGSATAPCLARLHKHCPCALGMLTWRGAVLGSNSISLISN